MMLTFLARRCLIGAAALCVSGGLARPHLAAAAVPEPIAYVGELVLTDGTPVDGTLNLEVALYAQAEGNTLLWGPYLFADVQVEGGVFSVLLGDLDTAPLDPVFAGADQVWTQFSIDGVELSPRQELLAVPYARVSADAARLGGTPAGDYALLSDLSPVATSSDYDDLIGAPSTFLDLQNAAGVTQITATKANQSIRVVGSGATTVTFDAGARRLTISSSDNNSGGDITGVIAGPGLSGGATTGDATLALAPPTASTLGGVLSVACGPGQVMRAVSTTGAIACVADANSGGTITSVGALGPLSSSGGNSPVISLTGTVPAANGGTGLSAPGGAGSYLRSNGSAWTSSALQSGDIPSGSVHYIQNQTGADQAGGFRVSGGGTLGGNLQVNGGEIALGAGTSNRISFPAVGIGDPGTSELGWKLRTWPNRYGIGISSGTQWYATASNHVWYSSSNNTTFTERMRLDDSGLLTVSGAIRPAAGDSVNAGLSFPPDPAGGTGDRGFLRYFAKSDEHMRMRLGVQNDPEDDVAIYAQNRDVMVISRDRIEVSAGLVFAGCPTGYTLTGGVCWRYSGTWGALTWTAAQDLCLTESNGHVCTYLEVLRSWGANTNHVVSRNGDWLGDFVADDEVLIVNNFSNRLNFEGSAEKTTTRQFVCCISH